MSGTFTYSNSGIRRPRILDQALFVSDDIPLSLPMAPKGCFSTERKGPPRCKHQGSSDGLRCHLAVTRLHPFIQFTLGCDVRTALDERVDIYPHLRPAVC